MTDERPRHADWAAGTPGDWPGWPHANHDPRPYGLPPLPGTPWQQQPADVAGRGLTPNIVYGDAHLFVARLGAPWWRRAWRGLCRAAWRCLPARRAHLARHGDEWQPIIACCLAHRRHVYLQGCGPDGGEWCHTDGRPCQQSASWAAKDPSAVYWGGR